MDATQHKTTREMWGAKAKAKAKAQAEAQPEEFGEECRPVKGGPWQRDVEKKLAEAVEIGVRSSGKPETRQYRVTYYTGKLAKAKLEVEYFESMLRLEDAMEDIPGRYDRETLDTEERLRRLKLKSRVATAQGRVNIQEYDDQEGTQLGSDSEAQAGEEWDTTLVKGEEAEEAEATAKESVSANAW
jgi:hypothetical protein